MTKHPMTFDSLRAATKKAAEAVARAFPRRHDWRASRIGWWEQCDVCLLERRDMESVSERSRDGGRRVAFVEVRSVGRPGWRKVPRGHALPPCVRP